MISKSRALLPVEQEIQCRHEMTLGHTATTDRLVLRLHGEEMEEHIVIETGKDTDHQASTAEVEVGVTVDVNGAVAEVSQGSAPPTMGAPQVEKSYWKGYRWT